jgi:two-component system, NarL family, invasion response regulator UvrY
LHAKLLDTQSRRLYHSSLPLEALSDREIEIVENIVTGMSTSELAQRLELDMSTISTYRRRAFKKLQVSNIIQLQEKLMAYRT